MLVTVPKEVVKPPGPSTSVTEGEGKLSQWDDRGENGAAGASFELSVVDYLSLTPLRAISLKESPVK